MQSYNNKYLKYLFCKFKRDVKQFLKSTSKKNVNVCESHPLTASDKIVHNTKNMHVYTS